MSQSQLDTLDRLHALASSRQRLTVLAWIAQHPACFTRDIGNGTGIRGQNLGRLLLSLEDLDVIEGDIPPGERRGRALRYTVKHSTLAELLDLAQKYLCGDATEMCDTPTNNMNS